MAHTTQQIRNISPKVITFLLLAFGLMFMVYALIFQKILLFAIIVCHWELSFLLIVYKGLE